MNPFTILYTAMGQFPTSNTHLHISWKYPKQPQSHMFRDSQKYSTGIKMWSLLPQLHQTVFIVVKCHMEINLNSSETIYVEYFHILAYDKSHSKGILIICLSCVLIFWLQNNEF